MRVAAVRTAKNPHLDAIMRRIAVGICAGARITVAASKRSTSQPARVRYACRSRSRRDRWEARGPSYSIYHRLAGSGPRVALTGDVATPLALPAGHGVVGDDPIRAYRGVPGQLIRARAPTTPRLALGGQSGLDPIARPRRWSIPAANPWFVANSVI